MLSLLPAGTYTLSFELSGFQVVNKTAALAPTQNLPINAQLGAASVTETVTVVGRTADVLTQTATVATNFKQDLIATLPTNRDINAVLLMSPSVHASGPGGNYSIAGAMSFESLFLINGVNVNETVRGQALSPYIEDAIQETTVATEGLSAEFGRFSGGVVNMVTKSGGNMFSGSFRDTLNNDGWRSYVTGNDAHPFRTGNVATGNLIDCETCGAGGAPSKIDLVIPQYEYTLGGPAVKDHLWFFTAGRLVDQKSSQSTIAPLSIPYTIETDRKRYEFKLTASPTSNHRFEGAFSKEALTIANNSQSAASSMDLASLFTNTQPTSLFTVNYNGIISRNFVVEGRFSERDTSIIGAGAPSTDRIQGTLLLDRVRGGRYFAPTFCGICDPETRNLDDEFVKGTYFKSTKGSGSHNMVFGYDTANDKRFANNYQSGSNYRVIGTTTTIVNGVIFPQWTPGPTTVLQYNPILQGSLGTKFRTHSLFYNDNWRVNNNVTVNLGIRWDKNHGVDSAGNLVASDSITSPRVGVVWDPKGDGSWTVSASASRYTAGLANTIANVSSSAGNSAQVQWTYAGPAINPVGTPAASLVDSATAIQTMFNWCAPSAATGFCTSAAPSSTVLPGVSVKIPGGLTSPNVRAYAFGVSHQITNRAVVRADYSFRDYHDFYSQRTDLSTGRVTNANGEPFDLIVIENTNAMKRRYQGLTVSTTYRVSSRTDVGGNYTLSHLWGNIDGESVAAGPASTDLFQYPEYKQQSWYAPEGDLSADQRHRATLWINYGVRHVNGLTLSVLENLGSGLPYGAVGTVDARSFVDPAINAKYVTPQGVASENYYYTNRDAFRTQGFSRTDFSASYNYGISAGSRKVDLFTQIQLLNVFNQQDLCGCGGSVFQNGGNLNLSTISGGTPGQSVLTSLNTPTLARFNPLTTAPVQGVNWNLAPAFGTPVNRSAFDSPRTFRITFGVRF